MINKRLLIKNLLAHNDECSFYDKKQQLNLHTREGKAKFLKHICALSNSNPINNSYIVVGVEDQSNEIIGDDFFDDSRIQNLVNAFLENPPKIQYENIPFPTLPKNKVIGLVTIRPKVKNSYFKKGIHTIPAKTMFVRRGSNSIPTENNFEKNNQNKPIVLAIENSSKNSIKDTLDGVIDFLNYRHKDMLPKYKVFKELFVICWAGISKKEHEKTFLSRVDIELINEQIKLFYSAQDEVVITYDEDTFTITEYVSLGLEERSDYYPLQKQTLYFFDNGYYKIVNEVLFQPPQFEQKKLLEIYNHNLSLIYKIENNEDLSKKEQQLLNKLPSTLMICYLNGFDDAKQKLIDAKFHLKKQDDPIVYESFKESMRILRKIKYEKKDLI